LDRQKRTGITIRQNWIGRKEQALQSGRIGKAEQERHNRKAELNRQNWTSCQDSAARIYQPRQDMNVY
jgi:hypothetical protein